MRMGAAENLKRLPGDLKAVVFDVDGTLYHLRELKRAVQLHFVRGNWQRPIEAWRIHRAVTAYRHAVDVLRTGPPVGVELSEAQLEQPADQKNYRRNLFAAA
jgi:FMN phosphatase YigB (HAD superfamily)